MYTLYVTVLYLYSMCKQQCRRSPVTADEPCRWFAVCNGPHNPKPHAGQGWKMVIDGGYLLEPVHQNASRCFTDATSDGVLCTMI